MKRPLKKSYLLLSALLFVFVMGMIPSVPGLPEEGMYPLSELKNVDLKKAGLKISVNEIYNPKGISLIDALVSLGGCTGSFVSPDGLIITNHHCAFGDISAASTTENNFLKNGFCAKTKADEIPKRGRVQVRIMESYEDVSEKVLKAVENITDPVARIEAIAKMRTDLGNAATDRAKNIVAQVSEMFIGKTYVLFKYRVIQDLRLVYAPPRTIGEFGGESDNWVWPRHTGDFSFYRAYVAPDGSSAPYSKNNVPFKPKKFLQVSDKGVDEGDFLFVLGYPGRTFRHFPSQYVDYQYKYQLPYISDLFEFQINNMLAISKGNPELELRYAPRIKGLANTMKNYKGKIAGLRKLQLVEQKKQEEILMKKFVEANPKLKKLYGTLFDDLEREYTKLMSHAQATFFFQSGISSSSIRNANSILEYVSEMAKPEKERKAAYSSTGLEATKTALITNAGNVDPKTETPLFLKVLKDALKFESSSKITALYNALGNNATEAGVDNFVNEVLMKSAIANKDAMQALLQKSPDEILNDPVIKFVKEITEERARLNSENDKINGELNKLLAQFVDVKAAYKNKGFIPDANSTLRLTYGHVKGYFPADATYFKPLTTLDGVIEKSYLGDDYEIPPTLKDLYEKKDFGRFYSKKLKGLPVAMLYDMDTTGGSSGSPVLNAYGQIVGVNFDRAYGATINDFAWNEAYSRSIAVDMRYVLWVTKKFNDGSYLYKEMGIKQ